MTATEIFEEMLRDPLLVEKYGLTEDLLSTMSLHERSDADILEIIKVLVNGVENNTPTQSLNSMVKTHFNI